MDHRNRFPRCLATTASAIGLLLAAPASASPHANPQTAALRPSDLGIQGAIRREGFDHSKVMELAYELMDGIGPRLTASPNLARALAWARDRLAGMGMANSRLEDWGEFGSAWEQRNVWARMTSPDTQPLSLQAAPWSASMASPVTAEVAWLDPLMPGEEMAKLKGSFSGKVVLLGAITPSIQSTEPLSHRYSAEELKGLETLDGEDGGSHSLRSRKGAALRLLRTEGVAAIVEPSRETQNGGGSGMIVDDNYSNIVDEPWDAAKNLAIPHAVMVREHYGRMARLIQRGTPVTMQIDIETRTTGEHEHGFNVVAEIPGTDPDLRAQVVLAGAHLDSWSAGTGATDDGAGVVVGMEAMRILKAIGVRPRRTIRLALWTGEEQGLYGSRGYVRDHLATFAPSSVPGRPGMPAWMAPRGAPIPKPDWGRFDVYFNLDAGAGRIRGIYTGGDLEAAAIFRDWIVPLADLGVTAVTTREEQGSDEEAFQNAGLPAFAFLQDPLDYETRAHHSSMDTVERLNERDLEQAAIVEATFLFKAAQRDAMLPRTASAARIRR